jgi:hypothetical protein
MDKKLYYATHFDMIVLPSSDGWTDYAPSAGLMTPGTAFQAKQFPGQLYNHYLLNESL